MFIESKPGFRSYEMSEVPGTSLILLSTKMFSVAINISLLCS